MLIDTKLHSKSCYYLYLHDTEIQRFARADVSQIVCGRKFFLGWGSLNSDAADVKRTQDPRRTHLEVRGNDTETAEVVRRHE